MGLTKVLLKHTLDLNFGEGFTFTSGMKSPVYCDNRLLTGNVKARDQVVKEFLNLIPNPPSEDTVIAGIATAGISWGAIVAHELGLPFHYIRPESKGHGAQKRIEGGSVTDKKVILIEDTITTGGSSTSAITELLREGAEITSCLCIFSYRLDAVDINFRHLGIQPISLVNFQDIIDYLEDTETPEEHLTILKDWFFSRNV